MNKKDKVLNKKKNNKGIAIIAIITSITVIAVLVLVLKPNSEYISQPVNSADSARSENAGSEDSNIFTPGSLEFDVSQFDDGLAKYFSYTIGNTEVKFFIVKSSDGVIRAAFDTCDVCFRAKKGYRQEGDLMICNNCGQAFPTSSINVEKGGCNPSPLDRTIEDDTVYIKIESIKLGMHYFI